MGLLFREKRHPKSTAGFPVLPSLLSNPFLLFTITHCQVFLYLGGQTKGWGGNLEGKNGARAENQRQAAGADKF